MYTHTHTRTHTLLCWSYKEYSAASKSTVHVRAIWLWLLKEMAIKITLRSSTVQRSVPGFVSQSIQVQHRHLYAFILVRTPAVPSICST